MARLHNWSDCRPYGRAMGCLFCALGRKLTALQRQRTALHWRAIAQIPHYNDVIMTTMASQISSLTVVYASVYWGADQRKHQSSASLVFVRGIHRGPVIPRTNGRLRGKCFHLMTSSWIEWWQIIPYSCFSYHWHYCTICHTSLLIGVRNMYVVRYRLQISFQLFKVETTVMTFHSEK